MLPYTVHTVHEAVWVILYLPLIVAPLFALMAGSLPPTRTTVEHLKDRRLGRLLKTT
jgi:hypothetical protein